MKKFEEQIYNDEMSKLVGDFVGLLVGLRIKDPTVPLEEFTHSVKRAFSEYMEGEI